MPILDPSQQQFYSLQKLTEFQPALLLSVYSTCSSAQTSGTMCALMHDPAFVSNNTASKNSAAAANTNHAKL